MNKRLSFPETAVMGPHTQLSGCWHPQAPWEAGNPLPLRALWVFSAPRPYHAKNDVLLLNALNKMPTKIPRLENCQPLLAKGERVRAMGEVGKVPGNSFQKELTGGMQPS